MRCVVGPLAAVALLGLLSCAEPQVVPTTQPEAVLRPAFVPASIVHENRMSPAYKLEEARYYLNGVLIRALDATLPADARTLAGTTIAAWSGLVPEGKNEIAARLLYTGHSETLSYLNDITFRASKAVWFTAVSGASVAITVVGYEDSGVTTNMEDRPQVEIKTALSPLNAPGQTQAPPSRPPGAGERAPQTPASPVVPAGAAPASAQKAGALPRVVVGRKAAGAVDAPLFGDEALPPVAPDSASGQDPGPPGDLVTIRNGKLAISQRVEFGPAGTELAASSFRLLKRMATVINGHPEIKKVVVEGHTDDAGRASTNQQLSQERAKAVRDYLVVAGVARDRIEAKGYGGTMPIASNRSETGRIENRRVEFRIVQ